MDGKLTIAPAVAGIVNDHNARCGPEILRLWQPIIGSVCAEAPGVDEP